MSPEDVARKKKADAVVEYLAKQGITAAHLDMLTPSLAGTLNVSVNTAWAIIAQEVGVNHLSPKTRALVRELLAERRKVPQTRKKQHSRKG